MIASGLAWLALLAVTAVVLYAYRAERVGVVVGLLFAAASFSRVTAPLGPYSIRLEQPAIVILIAMVLVTERGWLRRVVAGHKWLLAAGGLYLGANLLSSALFAARPVDSLRIASWLGLSMCGGLVVAALVARAPRAARSLPNWIVGAAAIQVGVGLAAVLSEATLTTTWGVQEHDVVLGKAYGLSWEANILAINLAMALALVLVPGSGLRVAGWGRLATALWLGFGLGLAYSRGGAVGLLAAAVLVAGVVAWTARADPLPALRLYLPPVLRLGLAAFAAALLTATGLDSLASQGVGWTPTTVVVGPQRTPAGAFPTSAAYSATAAPGSVSPAPSFHASPLPTPRYVGTGDTLALRLRNVSIGLGELPRSPLLGLGTDSYQQRHVEASCGCPAYISNLMVASLYDSGIVGFLGLVGLLGGVLYVAWRCDEWAYLVALLVMVIGYQATDAFRFASNWVVMGAVLGMATHMRNSTAGQSSLGGPAGRLISLGRSR